MSAGGFARGVTKGTSRQGGCEGDDQVSADRCDRVGDISFGTDGRRLGVDDFGERQTSRINRRHCRRLRGEPSPAQRSGRRKPRCTRWRDDGNRILVHAADIQDAEGLGDLLKRLKPLYVWLRAVFADSIYNRLAALLACYLAGLVLIILRRPAGTTGFVVQPRRWVVERSLGWFGRWRRLSKDYEALPEVSEAMVTLAAIRLMLHRLAHPNRRRLPAA